MTAEGGASAGSLAHVGPDISLPLLDGSVGDALRAAASRYPDHKVLTWVAANGPQSLTYAEMLDEAEKVAAWLLDRASPGDRIAIWSGNSVEWVVLEYGCALAGMVVASWNPAWTDYECQHALELTEPALVCAGHDNRGASLLGRAQALAPGRSARLDDLREVVRGLSRVELPTPKGEDLFLIQFTSGTTGRSKGAALSHRAALNSAWLRARASGLDSTDVWVNASPLNHVGGAVCVVLGVMVCGACWVMMDRFDAGLFLRLMRECGATRIGGVPTVLISMLDHPDWTPGSTSVRSIGAGGAQVPQPLIERLMAAFEAPVLVVYAQSEAPAITSSVAGDEPRLLAETVGSPIPHVELMICDATTGATLKRGAVGEVLVRGPMLMDGYFRMPEATAATITADGFLKTGDLGSIDDGGYLRIHGRVRDVIIRGGENIYPAEVEDVLLQHPGVASAAVVGAPDARLGQVVCAAIVPRDEAAPSTEDLEAFAGERLARFKVPRRWTFVDAFPLTPSGKIRKVEVEAMFEEARA